VTGLPLSGIISLHATHAAIEPFYGIWQSPAGCVTGIGGGEMGLRVALGLVVAVLAATSVDVPVTFADETGLATMHAWRRERGRICMSDHWHYGSSGAQRNRRTAQRAAIRSWQDFTALEYGSTWARFNRAASRKMGCSRSGAGWSCDAEARPCK
jgi:hypothetical protein